MIIYDNMIYFMMANDISRERNNIFRSNEMISTERNNIHFFHRCPLRGSVVLLYRFYKYILLFANFLCIHVKDIFIMYPLKVYIV